MGADFTVETMVDPSATPLGGSVAYAPGRAGAHSVGPLAPDSAATLATNGAQNAMAEDLDEVASRDDSDLTEDAQSHTELLARHLGAEIIARGGSRRIGWAGE